MVLALVLALLNHCYGIVTNTDLFVVSLVCVKCPENGMDNQNNGIVNIESRLIFKNFCHFSCGQCCDKYLYPSIAVSKFLDVFNICFWSLMNRRGHYFVIARS